jgi:4-amino-4-deoxy-L-arabinose transferase-like glycosyltransferase
MDIQDFKDRISQVDWQEKLTDKYFLAIAAIVLFGAFIRFNYAFDPGMWVDEGRYGVIANYLTEHFLTYRDPAHGVITDFPPVFPYLLAISSGILGKGEFAIKLISPLVGTAGIAVSYVLGSKMTNRNIGLLTAGLLAVSPTYWFMSNKVLVEVTLTVIYTAAILAAYIGFSDSDNYKYGLWALGPLVALGVMTKQPAFTLGLVLPIYFLYTRWDEVMDAWETEKFKESDLYVNTLSDINYYIGVGFGVLTMLPWTLRNIAVCGLPLCGVLKALNFASKDVSSPLADTAGTFFFIGSLPSIITLPVALIVVLRIGLYLWDWVDEDADYLVKAGFLTLILNGLTFFLAPRFFPMTLFTSMALYARQRHGKLLWLWIGIGVGFMSIPEIKVPRYILFTVPAFLILAGEVIHRLSNYISGKVENAHVTAFKVSLVILIPLMAFSLMQGLAQVQSSGFTGINDAGNWIAENSPEDAVVATTSPEQTRYAVHPRRTLKVAENESAFIQQIQEEDISYVQVDRWERTQAVWIQLSVPPYRLPDQMRGEIRSGRVSAQEVVDQYGQPPAYLEQVASFGQGRVPLTRDSQQPNSIVYRVNQSALE